MKGVTNAGFKVPEYYFDTLESKVFQNINDKKNKPVIYFLPKKAYSYISAIAASLLLLFALNMNNSIPETLSADIVENYFLYNEDLDSYELAQLLSDAQLLEENFVITSRKREISIHVRRKNGYGKTLVIIRRRSQCTSREINTR